MADQIFEYTETCPRDGSELRVDVEGVSCPTCGWWAVFEDWLAAETGDELSEGGDRG